MTQDEKMDNILEAANRRFAHFGVDKTTMNEIADDLGISKASLYYYFPDKLNLYAAVLQKIIKTEQGEENPYINEKELLKGFHKYLEKRTAFILRNYRILEYLRTLERTIPEDLKSIFHQAKTRDVAVIAAFLKKGNEEGVLQVPNIKRTTDLIHDCLAGLRMTLLMHQLQFFPDEKQFNELLSREKELINIFFKALKA